MGDVTELLERANEDDQQAWDELYRLTQPELRKLALHWIRRYSAKERVRTTEVIDRAFVKLMQIASPSWPHRGAFYVFASRNILSVLIDLLRHTARQPTSLPDGIRLDGIPAPDGNLTQRTLLTLREALEDLGRTLSETHRQVVELRFLGECTLNEVAVLLSISRDKVFRLTQIALEYLRDKLGSGFPDFGHSPIHASGD
jgi:RNA polymerase sigma factor (TIGR02999 family)